MKKINIDLEALIESIIPYEDEAGESYLDTENGSIIYIPLEIKEALDGGTLNLNNFPEWMHESVSEALLISEDTEERYIVIPKIDDNFYHGAVDEYVTLGTMDEATKNEIVEKANGKTSIKNFKSILLRNGDQIDKWYAFEDDKKREFALNWLKTNNIEIQ